MTEEFCSVHFAHFISRVHCVLYSIRHPVSGAWVYVCIKLSAKRVVKSLSNDNDDGDRDVRIDDPREFAAPIYYIYGNFLWYTEHFLLYNPLPFPA